MSELKLLLPSSRVAGISLKNHAYTCIISLLALAFLLLPFYLLVPLFYKVFSFLPLRSAITYMYLSPDVRTSSIAYFISCLLTFVFTIVLIVVWQIFVKRAQPVSLVLKNARPLLKYGRGLVIGFLMITVMLLLLICMKRAIHIAGTVTQIKNLIPEIFLSYTGWMVQGPKEEFLFRGWLLPALSSYYKPRTAILLSSVVFACGHLLNPNINWLAFLNLTLFGIFVALYALAEESLWGVFAFHSTWNWCQSVLFGLPVSGILYRGLHLFSFTTTGPVWLTGGNFGLEGGVPVTGSLLVGIAYMLLRLQRRDKLKQILTTIEQDIKTAILTHN